MWQDNIIQFPRLLSEIEAVAELSTDQLEAVAESMGLDTSEIHTLFVRANTEFQKSKETVLSHSMKLSDTDRTDLIQLLQDRINAVTARKRIFEKARISKDPMHKSMVNFLRVKLILAENEVKTLKTWLINNRLPV